MIAMRRPTADAAMRTRRFMRFFGQQYQVVSRGVDERHHAKAQRISCEQKREKVSKGWRDARRAKNCIIIREMRDRVCAGFVAFFSSIGALIILAGCQSLPPSKPASEWTTQEARGAQVFQAACAKCHYPTSTHGLHGPGLQAITKIKAMPSGAPPTDERLTAVILHGHGTMPGTSLDDQQLQDLLAYLHTL